MINLLHGSMHRFSTWLIISVFCCAFVSGSANAKDQCTSIASLKLHTGYYARKEFWEYLLANKNWSKAINTYFDKEISEIYINDEGTATLLLSWWEGMNADCVQFHGNELWIGDDGPFIHVGQPSQDDSAIYVEQIFRNQCYLSNAGEKWCISPSFISINSVRHKIRLVLPAEHAVPGTPAYGTPLQIDDQEEKLWMFVPTKTGWKVFQDTFQDAPEYKKIDPNQTPPWRELKPLIH